MTSTNSRTGEISLRALLRILWHGKWLITGSSMLFTIGAVVIALNLPNVYRAEALLAPSQEEGGSSLARFATQYGGLAGLAGINLGGNQSDKTALGLATLRSRKFISEFIDRRDVLVPLMASMGWDEVRGNIKIDPDIYEEVSGTWVRKVSSPRQAKPSHQEAYENFRKILTINRDQETGFVKVSVKFYSPLIAKQWVEWLVEDLNSTVMRQDVATANHAIEYLNEQVAQTSLSDLRDLFYGLIEEQLKTVLLAKVTPEYLLKTIDPAVVPEEKAGPRRTIIVILSFVLGGIIGTLIQLVRHGLNSPV